MNVHVHRRLGLAEMLAECIRDRRVPALITHTLAEMMRLRMFATACGYEDGEDCDRLRSDSLFKLAVGQAPESGRDLCSQPTMSRLENMPSRIEAARMTAALADMFWRDFPALPATIMLDIDDTCETVHGHQQLSLFHAHYDTGFFLPIHVYHVESGKPVVVFCVPVRRHREARFALSSSIWSATSGSTGRAPGSSSGEILISPARRSWPGARRTASITSSACRATPC